MCFVYYPYWQNGFIAYLLTPSLLSTYSFPPFYLLLFSLLLYSLFKSINI